MAESGVNVAPKKQYLFMTIHEAWGLSKEQEPVWDDSFKEGYVRVEVRGGSKVQKTTTFTKTVENYAMDWRQDLRLELTEASKELRIMLCKEKARDATSKKSASVVAACGIFVKDIIDAVPIDKAFELFKPGETDSTLGGYIRVTLHTGPNVPSVPTIEEGESRAHEEEVAMEEEGEQPTSKSGNLLRILLLAGLAATITIFRIKTHHKKRNS